MTITSFTRSALRSSLQALSRRQSPPTRRAAPTTATARAPAATSIPGRAADNAKRNPTVTYVLKGTVVSVDAAAGMAVVKVAEVNHQRHSGQGLTVTFDLTKAKIAVADVNTDTLASAADIAVGDWALVQARLPRRSPNLTGTVVAHKARRPDPSRA